MRNLFRNGTFKLHSGETSNFKIECDALSTDDLVAIVRLIAGKYDFRNVFGIETGGELLGAMLRKHNNRNSDTYLIVDDVLTTGNSMEHAKKLLFKRIMPSIMKIQGIVIFARGKCPDWIIPIFQMDDTFLVDGSQER